MVYVLLVKARKWDSAEHNARLFPVSVAVAPVACGRCCWVARADTSRLAGRVRLTWCHLSQLKVSEGQSSPVHVHAVQCAQSGLERATVIAVSE